MIRVLQSFPHKIGASRICTTAWHQAAGASTAGAEVTVIAGSVHRTLPSAIRVKTTLARGRWRLPYKMLGSRAFALHDRMVARALPSLAGQIDLVHTWPLAAGETLRTARRLGIPTVLERPNAHTRFAYEVVARECERLGVALPKGHEHAFNDARLAQEEEEYALADMLLCPSEFVKGSFVDRGFSSEALARHVYGFDDTIYYASDRPRERAPGLTVLFAGICAVRKGLHFALEAWLASPASESGKLRIAGDFVATYRDRLSSLMAHPSIEVLGHRNDLPELMRESDVLVLPSLEEGFPLVCVEAMACGCVPLVSEACDEVHRQSGVGLVHRVGDVAALTRQLTMLHRRPDTLARLREACLAAAPEYTWTAAGARLVAAYEAAVATARNGRPAAAETPGRSSRVGAGKPS